MKVERLDHVHIYVQNLEQATELFSRVLSTTWSDIMVDDRLFDTRSSLSPLGVELIEGTSPESPVSRAIAKRGEGVFALSFKVDDLEMAVKELEAKGLRCVGRMNAGRLKEAQFHPKDSHGVMIELCEYADVHPAALAALGRY